MKLPDEIENRIEAILLDGSEAIELKTGVNVGRRVGALNALAEYKEFLLGTTDTNLRGLKIVLDCAHGAASVVGPRAFQELGATVVPYYNTPDGTNINDFCGSTHPQKLTQLVAELGADMGLAFDGDADRLIAVDEHGVVVDGDQIMAICAIDLKKRGLLKQDTLVCTVMSNLGLDIAMEQQGIRTKGRSIDGNGIYPEEYVELSGDGDSQMDKAQSVLRAMISAGQDQGTN